MFEISGCISNFLKLPLGAKPLEARGEAASNNICQLSYYKKN